MARANDNLFHIAEPLRGLARPVDGLILDPRNARKHSRRNLDAIRSSFLRFGVRAPIVVRKETGVVLAGNGRLMVARELGWTNLPVVEVEGDADVDAISFALADNRTAELAEWDSEVLAELLNDGVLGPLGSFDVMFSEQDLKLLSVSLDESPGKDLSDLDDIGLKQEPKIPVTRSGDVWVLGEHLLFCGSATERKSFDILLGEERVNIVFTDPPYGVNYVGGTEDSLPVLNDDPEGLPLLLKNAFELALRFSEKGAVWYVCAPPGPNFLIFAENLSELGVWRQTLIWVKDVFVLGHSDFHYRHESIFYGWTPGAAHKSVKDRTNDTVWEFPRPKVSEDHPTIKPMNLVRKAIELSSDVGDIVLDPFAGSGTTLLVAHQTQRVARCIELSPSYCDVIVSRWEAMTGEKAKLR